MNSNLTKLEFDKILEQLSDYCKTYVGKELCKKILPSNDIETVKYMLKQTSEAYTF